MKTLMRAFACISLLLSGPSLMALPWDKDMVDQPAVKAQEKPVEPVAGTVPSKGKESLPRPKDGKELATARVEAGRKMINPQRATPESIAKGKIGYETHCLICHGAGGKGDGSVGLKHVPPPLDLTLPFVRTLPDGQIYYTITHGSLIMPFYREALEPVERWDIVNYVKYQLGRK